MTVKTLFLALTLASIPTFARGSGIDLSWSDCVNGTPLNNVNFDCNANGSYDLNFQFKSWMDIPSCYAATVYMDYQNDTGTPLTPFWHFEAGGCQNTPATKGVVLFDDVSNAPANCAAMADLWGGDGTEGYESFAAYGADFHRPGNGYFVLTDYRAAGRPVVAGVNYWLFRLRFRTNNRAACPGCSDRGAFMWQRLALESDDSSPSVNIDNPDKFSNCLLVNSGPSCYCDVHGCATKTTPTTWTRMKSLYR